MKRDVYAGIYNVFPPTKAQRKLANFGERVNTYRDPATGRFARKPERVSLGKAIFAGIMAVLTS